MVRKFKLVVLGSDSMKPLIFDSFLNMHEGNQNLVLKLSAASMLTSLASAATGIWQVAAGGLAWKNKSMK